MIIDSGSDRAKFISNELKKHLLPHGAGIDSKSVIVAIGGDGFLLDCISKFGTDKHYVPINGGTLGFLLNDIGDNYEKAAHNIDDYNVVYNYFSTIHAVITHKDGSISYDRAVNEVCIERMSSQTTRLDVTVDGALVSESMAADGLIVSTALGSTGYNFSAGGAICQGNLPVRVITPICAHHPRMPPFVIPDTSMVLVSAHQIDKRPVKVSVDGREHPDVKEVVMSRSDPATLGYFAGHNFTHQLVNKILKR